MNYWIEVSVVAVGISALLTGLIIPQILVIAFRRKLFDDPDKRKVHKGVVPRLGGLSFLPSILCALTLVVAWNLRFGVNPAMTDSLQMVGVKVLFLFCSLTILFLLGLADDLIGVRYRAKFAIQIACACLTLLSGVSVGSLYGVFGIEELPDIFSWILTGFMVVFIINSINLIDGIDGLASGLCGLVLMFYGWIFYLNQQYFYSVIAWTTFGVLATFFYYNVFGNAKKGKKIFMGDTGSLTIGMIISFLTINISSTTGLGNLTEYNPLILAFSPLIIPLFDVVRVCLHRFRKKRSPFLPDRSHIHHKLLDMGFSSGTVLTIILSASIVFTVLNVALSPILNINIILAGDIVVYSGVNIWITDRIHKREKETGDALYD